MSSMLVYVAVSALGAVWTGDAPVVEIRPAAITLDAVPEAETLRSCVLRYRGGVMNVLSVAATDPAIVVDLRENVAGGTYVVTAAIPALP